MKFIRWRRGQVSKSYSASHLGTHLDEIKKLSTGFAQSTGLYMTNLDLRTQQCTVLCVDCELGTVSALLIDQN